MFSRFPGPGGPGWDHALGLWFLGWLLPVLLLVGITALVVWAVLQVTARRRPNAAASRWWPGPGAPADPALEQARLRYARGEMSREEFLQVSSDLQAGPRAAPAAGQEGSAPDEAPPRWQGP